MILALPSLYSCVGRDHDAVSSIANRSSNDKMANPLLEVPVYVLAVTYSSIPGASFDDYQVITEFQYDEQGRVVSSSQSSNYPDPVINLCNASYDYDGKGRLEKITNAFEQYDWSTGSVIRFSYDQNGLCSSYLYQIVSQGVGEKELSYSYGNGSRIDSAEEVSRSTSDVPAISSHITWSYFDNGLIKKITANDSSAIRLSYLEELSNPQNGIYAYQDQFETTITLRFNERGQLTDKTSSNQSSFEQTHYEYKKITVSLDQFIPSVVSNPTGFDFEWMPQLSDKQLEVLYNRKNED